MKFIKNFAIGLLILSLPLMVFAQDALLDNMPQYMEEAPSSTSFNLFKFINTIINWLFYALLVAALVMLLLLAINYVTAGGSGGSDKVKTNLSKLSMILLGIVVALLAKALIYVTCYIVGGSEMCTFKFN